MMVFYIECSMYVLCGIYYVSGIIVRLILHILTHVTFTRTLWETSPCCCWGNWGMEWRGRGWFQTATEKSEPTLSLHHPTLLCLDAVGTTTWCAWHRRVEANAHCDFHKTWHLQHPRPPSTAVWAWRSCHCSEWRLALAMLKSIREHWVTLKKRFWHIWV